MVSSCSLQHPGHQPVDEPLVAGVGQIAIDRRELVQRGAGEPVRPRPAVPGRAVPVHAAAHPGDVFGRPLGARPGEEVAESRAAVGARRAEQLDQHDRPLPLPDVAVDLLAVAGRVAEEVQEVVLDLEGCSQEEAEADEAVEVAVAARPDERADAARPDGRVPAGLLEHHLEIVGLAEVEHVVAAPAELDRLPLDRLARHPLRLLEDEHREPRAEAGAVVDQRARAEERERGADVHGDGHAVQRGEGRPPAALVAPGFDVGVQGEGVGEGRDAGGRRTRTVTWSPSATIETSASRGFAGSTARRPCTTRRRPAASGRRSTETSAGRVEATSTRTRAPPPSAGAARVGGGGSAGGGGAAMPLPGRNGEPPASMTFIISNQSPNTSEGYCTMRTARSCMSLAMVSVPSEGDPKRAAAFWPWRMYSSTTR